MTVNCENYTQETVIGQCTQISENNLQVVWMKGTYSTSWEEWMVRDPNNRRKLIPWSDRILLSSITLLIFN